MSERADGSGTAPARVCDRCVRKVKCDLQQPTCSRCREVSASCTYSLTKKKPGPRSAPRPVSSTQSKVKRASVKPRNEPSTGGHGATGEQLLSSPYLTTEVASASASRGNAVSLSGVNPGFRVDDPLGGLTGQAGLIELDVSATNSQAIIGLFFERIHPSIPLFEQRFLMQAVIDGTVDKSLYNIIIAITLRLLPSDIPQADVHNAEAHLSSLLSSSDNTPSGSFDLNSSLSMMQRSCLLAYYGFHDRPGLKSWIRIGLLTRKAYALGLSQLDSAYTDEQELPPLGADTTSQWRRIWWVIYCLDSYSSITSGTPFVVEQASLATALKYNGHSSRLLFLPVDTEDLWQTANELAREATIDHFSIHIVATVLIKEAATLFRLQKQRPSRYSNARLTKLEDLIAAVRLALPPGYLSPARMTLRNETSLDHQARLVNAILIKQASTLLSMVPILREQDSRLIRRGWQKVMHCCGDVVATVKVWETDMLTTADPAVCFIVSATLSLLHLYGKCEPDLPEDDRHTLARHENILKLFLQQFAAHWYLPRFVLSCYERLCEQFKGPVTYSEALRAIKMSHGLLFAKELAQPTSVAQQSNTPAANDIGTMDDTWLDMFEFGDWSVLQGFFGFENLHSNTQTLPPVNLGY
ncbi:NADPH-dependent 1-acyldihydroxyacetone phosphate reductase [Teratosphaeria destructans]|uniref:NADPH-dependent 1-acyldihydroxyacetone phosphate reductase n=1 Tax=Teratosphaeria destructans TaxID=418781 RepID=A0A9W7SJ76_9PEZI|nr:NADPH-dependent 1-acyldihydroxyacetone phosphate reductase [Teratosphaeria destructans]